jgi:hypothetical protein
MSHSQLDEFAAILARDLGSPEDMIARTEWHEVRPRVRGPALALRRAGRWSALPHPPAKLARTSYTRTVSRRHGDGGLCGAR